MARVFMTLLGLLLLAVGIWLIILWWEAVKVVLLACVALGVALLGLFLLIFGLSEIAGSLSRKTPEG